ncbi:hypothetical protein GIB67_020028 [Kingdonia uniflora]|uniref:CCHC-type domain-containing protein n=1 Tax=Kingdonia uniflora TaxID=39325 RepID=A0A7J7N4L2_9MAGN|nr:hypothetical protein GIB67_020028 [Kingdonia uniflora]
MGRSKYLNMIKFYVEKFDGKINFGLWQIQVQDILTQGGLRKALKGKPIPKTPVESIAAQKADDDKKDDWEDLNSRDASGIRFCLTKNVLPNVAREKTVKSLWEKLESLYQIKSLSNRLYPKERLHTLKMNEGTTVGDHLGSLNGIASELELMGVKVEDEDMALQLIWSLPSTFKHLQPSLMYGKESLSFEEVTSTPRSEKRRLKDSESLGKNSVMVVSGKRSFNRFIKGTCWCFGQSGHYRSDCKARKGIGASSTRGFESDTNKLATVTSNDGDQALLMVATDCSRHDREWVFDSGAIIHSWFFKFLLNCIVLSHCDLPPRFPSRLCPRHAICLYSRIYSKFCGRTEVMAIRHSSTDVTVYVNKAEGDIEFFIFDKILSSGALPFKIGKTYSSHISGDYSVNENERPREGAVHLWRIPQLLGIQLQCRDSMATPIFLYFGLKEFGGYKRTNNDQLSMNVVKNMIEEVVLQRRFKYLPHVSSEDMKAGFYDKLESELQGLPNTYYVGRLMVFELIERNSSYAMAFVVKHFMSDNALPAYPHIKVNYNLSMFSANII